MKTLIIAINSKYIHSSLAPWYLKAYCGSECGEIKILESTINESIDSILAAIYREKADVAAFSCYIWNIGHVLKIVKNLKKISPGIKIILGGPEASFDSNELMKSNPFVDYIICGEGEESFKKLLIYLDMMKEAGCSSLAGTEAGANITLESIDGILYRNSDTIVENKAYLLVDNLDSIPSPYTNEMLSSLGNRIVYYESSRGCPFSCAYCLSSTFKGVRHFSLDRVKQDLKRLAEAGIKQIKFVDRTFNCSRQRAKDIFTFIINELCNYPSIINADTNFHFEAAADLFDDEMMEILKKAPPGRIQFEIGIQSTNSKTLEAVGRKTDLQRVFHYVRMLKQGGNIHLHLDLIAGLPYEGYSIFRQSFNQVHELKPDQFQLGFLKMLKGSRIRNEAQIHTYMYRDYPPYEVLCNNYISYDEMLELKGIEEMVDRYWNSERFGKTINYILHKQYYEPFEFYRMFYKYSTAGGMFERSLSLKDQYTLLLDFLMQDEHIVNKDMLRELLRLDFLSSDSSGNLPKGLVREYDNSFKEACFEFLKNESNAAEYLPQFKGIPAKQIYKQVHFEEFKYDVTVNVENLMSDDSRTVVLFNYALRDKVTGLYKYERVKIQ